VKAVVQRVTSAEVTSNGNAIAAIGVGLVVLVGIQKDDSPQDAEWLAAKTCGLRVFDDDAGKLGLSVDAVGGEILVVSNFTVCGDVSKGRRPSFDQAADYENGRVLFELFVQKMRKTGIGVQVGDYGAEMRLTIVNDGPVTLFIDSRRPT
jgi:D-tyrosyl-tRNA(Tyr) deacylase